MKDRTERVLDALNAARKAQEELKEKIRGEVTAYLKENVEHFKERSSIAWDRIDHYRAPLSNIAPDLHSEIEEIKLNGSNKTFVANTKQEVANY